MAIALQGIVVPLLSPYTRGNETFDEPAYRRLIDFVIGHGAHAIIANAATSEFNSLDESERLKAAEIAVEHARGRVPVLVGAGAPATRHSIRFAKHAESIGADGLLIVPPFYGTCPIDNIVGHYAAISDACSLPIMLYNALYAQNFVLTPTDVERLAGAANIPWVKLTTGVPQHVTEIRERMGDRMAIFEGVDTLAYASMCMGADGWVAGTANMIPDLAVELWRLTKVEGDMRAARALNDRIDPLHRFTTVPTIYFAVGKEVCRLRGVPLGGVRLPWDNLTTAQAAQALKLAADLGLLDTTIAKVA